MPKQNRAPCVAGEMSKGLAMRRFAGMMIFLAGLLHTGIWLLAPLEQASTLAMMAVAGSLAIVLLRALILRVR